MVILFTCCTLVADRQKCITKTLRMLFSPQKSLSKEGKAFFVSCFYLFLWQEYAVDNVYNAVA